MKQQVRDNNDICQSRSNGMYQQKYNLDMESDEIWMLKMRVPERGHTKVRRIANNKSQLTIRIFISKASGQQQNKIWNLGELKTLEV